MKTKKLVVRVHGHAVVRYTGDLVIEVPQEMCESCIRRMAWINANELPEPDWVGNDRNGRNTVSTDDTDRLPEIIGLASSDMEPDVRLEEDEDGDIRIVARDSSSEGEDF